MGALLAGRQETGDRKQEAGQETADEGEAVAPTDAATEGAGQRPALPQEGAPNAWPDDASESAMVAELRSRGEAASPTAAREAVEEIDPKALPPLDDLVKRIPANVRETLDDLFRAKFVRVTRVPKKALKEL